jgi:hypothetical protein
MNLLNPSICDFSFLDCRRRVELLRSEAARLNGGARILLDVGGRGRPYAPLFDGHVERHYVLDLETGDSVNVVADARRTPVGSQSVDVVLCTQVLEHVPEPQAVIAEIHRMLKPGGRLLLTVPSIFPQHGGPGDYWRYTADGLTWMLRDFERVDIRVEAGTVGSFCLVVNMYLFMLTGRSEMLRTLVSWLVCPLTNVVGLAVDTLYRGEQFPSNLFAVATR